LAENALFDVLIDKIRPAVLADRTNGRAIATLFRLSVCDVMYCG